jgi:tetratricopeptide (TPR) repeat protein
MKSVGRATILCLVLCVLPAGADTIHLRSAESIRYVRVLAFKDGRLETVDIKQGRRRLIDYWDIALIRVDGQPNLNEAEKLLAARQQTAAVKAYQAAFDKTPARGAWMSVWTKVRLLNLFAALGQVDRVVETYIDLARQIPDWVILVSPTPGELKAPEAQLDAAGRRLVQARDESRSPKTREALAKFYQRLGGNRALPAAKDMQVLGAGVQDVAKFDQPGPWLDAWAEEKIKAGNADAVRAVTDRLFVSSLRRNLPAVFYWCGRALLAKGNYDAAALSLLEVAVEFPAAPYAPTALFHAARAAAQAGRIEYARTLWRELIDNFGGASEYTVIQLVEQARDALHEKE